MRRMWQREGTLKQMSLTCMKVTKGFVTGIRGEERYNHQQSFTTASRQKHIVVKVLALWYKNRIKTFCKYVKFYIKPCRPCKIHEHCLFPLIS